MDGQPPPNINGTKNIIPGVTGNNVFLPSLFTQPSVPTSSACSTDPASVAWTKNPVLQNWVDTQTKNLQYNMFAGNMAVNGNFGSTLDNAWQNPSSSQPNINPLLAAFQQQYSSGKKATSNSSSTLNPLLTSSHLPPASSSSFHPQSLHPTPSALNPPLSQPKQPPKSPSESLFSSLPFPSGAYGIPPADAAKISPLNYQMDQLREIMSGHLSATQSFPPSSAPSFSMPKPTPIARPHQQSAPSTEIPTHPFGLLSAVVPSNGAKNESDLHRIIPSNPPIPSLSMPSLISPIPSTSTSMSYLLANSSSANLFAPAPLPSSSLSTPTVPSLPLPLSLGTGASRLSAPSDAHAPASSLTLSASSVQIPSTSTSLGVPMADGTLISPRTGKRRSGGHNGDLARPPSEGGLDIDLDGFDLFDGMTMGDQEAVLNSTLNFDETLFSEEPIGIPVSTALDPLPASTRVIEPTPKIDEPKKEEVSSASSKMALLRACLNKSRAPPPDTTAKAAPTTSAADSIIAAASAPLKVESPAVTSPLFQKPATPQGRSEKPTFTPPLSPVDLSDPAKHSTGISSLIAASILPSELMLGRSDTPDRKKTVPVYLRPKTDAPPTVPVYKQKEERNDCKDDEFAFTDEDPEEMGEKLLRDDESEEEPETSVTTQETKTAENKDARITNYIKGLTDSKDAEKDQRTIKPETKKPAPVYPGRDRHARQESLEFAERLQKRRKELGNSNYANVQQCEHNQCAIDSVQKNVDDADKPPLPRLLIRLPKKSIGSEERKRRKKKRQYYEDGEEDTDDSDDWYGGRPKKRRGRKPKRELHPDESYSVRLVDPATIEHARKEVHVRTSEYHSRKDKFLRNWREENAAQHDLPAAPTGRGVEGKLEPKPLAKIVTEYKNNEARERLQKFKHCSGYTPRGTFLVLKAEINTPECALWRVDNMNLLQKFPGFLARTQEGGPLKMLYKNSSTYSGWCEQLQPGYMVIEVRHVKQTRSECVVEPLVVVDDLFPAISEELTERYCVPRLKAFINKEDAKEQAEARAFILKDDVRNGLYMVIRNMLEGALAFDYFSRAKDATVGGLPNPANELLSEMECHVKECEETIKEQISFGLHFESNLKKYSSCLAIQCELSEILCQVCGEEPVEKTLQLFDPSIDEQTKDEDSLYFDQEALLPAVDFLVCEDCCKLALWQHCLIHFRHDLARRIEDRLLEGTLEMPSFLPEQVVDNLRQCYTWLKEVIVGHTNTWDLIMKSEESEDEDKEMPPVDAVKSSGVSAPEVCSVVAKDSSINIPNHSNQPVEGAISAQLVTLPAPEQTAESSSSDAVDDEEDALIDPVTI